MHTGGDSCLAWALRRWAAKPNMKTKILETLNFFTIFDHEFHVPHDHFKMCAESSSSAFPYQVTILNQSYGT